MKINIRAIFVTLFVCTITVLFIPAAFAQSGDVNADNKLNFLSAKFNGGSNLQGALEVPLNPQFTLQFDKNVVNIAVWNNNANCFSLQSESGESVPINITKIDDTVDFNQRQNIFIQPAQALNPGTTYSLKIAPNLLAINGNSTFGLGGTTGGMGLAISFKTSGQSISNQGSNQGISSSTSSTSATTTPIATTPVATTPSIGTLNKATVLLGRLSTLFQSMLYMQNSIEQFKLPLS